LRLSECFFIFNLFSALTGCSIHLTRQKVWSAGSQYNSNRTLLFGCPAGRNEKFQEWNIKINRGTRKRKKMPGEMAAGVGNTAVEETEE